MNAKSIAEKLNEANCRFYHAINLRAFATYCSRAAILSRTQLKTLDAATTPFWSDPGDEQRGVMDRVFGNLYDFGEIFARARKQGAPNVYGPITLVMSPAAFSSMNDIVITKKSIVSLSGNWRDHALDDTMVDEMLTGDDYGSPIAGGYHFSELSCKNNAVAFAALERIVVEPLSFEAKSLVDEVKTVLDAAGIKVPVVMRHYANGEHLTLIQGLVNTLCAFRHGTDKSRMVFQDVPKAISKMDKPYRRRFETWATYLYFDTVCYLRNDGDDAELRHWEEGRAEWRGRAAAYFELTDEELEELADRGEYHPKHNPDVSLLECHECNEDSVMLVEADIGVCTNLNCREILRFHQCSRCGEATANHIWEYCASCQAYMQDQMERD